MSFVRAHRLFPKPRSAAVRSPSARNLTFVSTVSRKELWKIRDLNLGITASLQFRRDRNGRSPGYHWEQENQSCNPSFGVITDLWKNLFATKNVWYLRSSQLSRFSVFFGLSFFSWLLKSFYGNKRIVLACMYLHTHTYNHAYIINSSINSIRVYMISLRVSL